MEKILAASLTEMSAVMKRSRFEYSRIVAVTKDVRFNSIQFMDRKSNRRLKSLIG